jgi:hypothetical protein
MTFGYNKNFSWSYLHLKGQKSPNEFLNTYPFDHIKLCFFYGNIFMSYPLLQCQQQFKFFW